MKTFEEYFCEATSSADSYIKELFLSLTCDDVLGNPRNG